MLRSIRWTLQLWHAAILVLAVVGIGLTSYFAIQIARYHQVDSELEAAGQLIVARLRMPVHPPRFRRPDDGMHLYQGPDGAPDRGPDGEHAGGLDGGRNGPPDYFGPGGPDGFGDVNDRHRFGPDDHGPPDRLPPTFEMPPGFMQRYGGNEQDARSFVIYDSDGAIYNAFGVPFDKKNLPAGNLRPAENTLVHREQQALHEVFLPGPVNSTILVTGSVQRVNDELRQLLTKLAAAGAGVLLIGFVGGGLISRMAVRPIRSMSATAGSISATRLAERIDPRRVPTELRELALVLNGMFERLEIAFAQQARFTADASHELRTPLAVVLSHTELAMSRDRSAAEYRKTIETCNAAAVRMKSLVESLLLLSHADVGELALKPVPMDLSDVVRDNVNMLSTLAAARSITIATQLQNVTLLGDPMRIGQVVANLLSNAIRYNQEGGSISLSTEISGNDAVLTVADTGAGISLEDQEHVFERFFRADKARTRVAGGSGLGLAICKSIVEAHEGTISVTSQLGSGTKFTVHFPRRIEQQAPRLPQPIQA